MGCLAAICKSDTRLEPKVDVGRGELRAGYGLVGDAHAGLGKREVSLLALERIQQANRRFGIDASPGSFAENLTVAGVRLDALRLGAKIRVGATLLEVVQIGKVPHLTHTYNFRGFSISPIWGIFCRVVEGGEVVRGDEVQIL
ncbi:MAG: MOSC domain-containing protein [Anaerolineales bacterium]